MWVIFCIVFTWNTNQIIIIHAEHIGCSSCIAATGSTVYRQSVISIIIQCLPQYRLYGINDILRRIILANQTIVICFWIHHISKCCNCLCLHCFWSHSRTHFIVNQHGNDIQNAACSAASRYRIRNIHLHQCCAGIIME